MLLTIIDRKLSYNNNSLIEIDTCAAKASQFNHIDQSYKKKKLSQRWNDFNGIKFQRDLYSAFLIMNINEDLKSFDINKCNERFETFLNSEKTETQNLFEKIEKEHKEWLDECQYFLGDKGYDSSKILEWLEGKGIHSIIDIRDCWKDGKDCIRKEPEWNVSTGG